MRADLDTLLTAIYVLVDDFLPAREGPGRRPRISDAELVAVAIAQVLLGLPNDRQFLALAGYRLALADFADGLRTRLRAVDDGEAA